MQYLFFGLVFVLFYLTTPGTFFKLPLKQPPYVHALLHAFIFTIVFFVLQHFFSNTILFEGLEDNDKDRKEKDKDKDKDRRDKDKDRRDKDKDRRDKDKDKDRRDKDKDKDRRDKDKDRRDKDKDKDRRDHEHHTDRREREHDKKCREYEKECKGREHERDCKERMKECRDYDKERREYDPKCREYEKECKGREHERDCKERMKECRERERKYSKHTASPTTYVPSSTTLPYSHITPTTRAPTTMVTTTRAPTTMVPTTMVPTIMVPTTRAPTTMVPTTMVPTTMVPTTRAPTTMVPTTGIMIDTSTINQNIAIQGISGAILGSGKNYNIGNMDESLAAYLIRTDSAFANQYNTYKSKSIPIDSMLQIPVPASDYVSFMNPIAYTTLSELVTGVQQLHYYSRLDYTIHLNSNSIQGVPPGRMLLLVFKQPGLQNLRYIVNWGNNPSAFSVIQVGQ